MKKFKLLISSLSFSILVGCGGGGYDEPPISKTPSIAAPVILPVVEKEYKLVVVQDVIWEYVTNELMPSYTYGGITNPEKPISFFINAPIAFDFWKNGNNSVLLPIWKGYASGVDPRFVPVLLKSDGEKFTYGNNELDSKLTAIQGLSRTAIIDDGENKFQGVFGVAHETTSIYSSEALLIKADKVPKNVTPSLPILPLSSKRNLGDITNVPNSVAAHSMAVGDLNGDGLSDIIVGEWKDINGPYKLIQTSVGKWEVQNDTFLKSLVYDWKMVNALPGGKNRLLDLHLVDVNNDKYPDLIAGWGHGSTPSYVFLNDGKGEFSLIRSKPLPNTVYGIDNSLHLKTISKDINSDGNIDLIIISSKNEAYYGGYYIQILIGNGKGDFTDETDLRMKNLNNRDKTHSKILDWSNSFYLLDVNKDGHDDIVGSDQDGLRLWINDQKGSFKETTVKNSNTTNMYTFFTTRKNNIVTAIAFRSEVKQSQTRIWFSQLDLVYE
jgi:hypothetical protein